MLSLTLQRSPRSKVHNLTPHPPSASRLHRSASVPKLNSLIPPPQTHHHPSKKPHPPRKASLKSRDFDHHAPYPVSYENAALSCDALDNLLLKQLRKSCTWVDFSSSDLPKRCLDLGCGAGAWIMDAAKEWPECNFVGFDLVDVQPPLAALPAQIASRVTWVHGSFLARLPFDDDHFDHVHIRQIARGVPEDMWDHIMAEVVRVLIPGGTVEIFEEDIIFPVLPRSSTATPHQRERKRSTILRPSSSITKHHSVASLPAHDHAVLEVLFYRVFERRFINLRPTALIMDVLNAHLCGAGGSPVINFPLPRAPPFPPSKEGSRAPTPMPPRRRGDGNTLVVPDTDTPGDVEADTDTDTASGSRRSGSGSEPSTPATSITEHVDPADGHVAFYSGPGMCGAPFLPEGQLAVVTEGTLGMNLYRSWQGVMSCREAIWEEYCKAIQHREALLAQVDWEYDDLRLTDRQRFDILLTRYKTDMEARYPISDALVADLQWVKPKPDLSKEDKGKQSAVMEVRRDALRLERSGIGAVPESSRVCRKGRMFVATKGRGGVYHGAVRRDGSELCCTVMWAGHALPRSGSG